MSNAYRHVFQKRLNADSVQMGEKLQIKGDQERRDQMEYVVELKAQETLRQAEIQSQELMSAARQEAAALLQRSREEGEATAAQLVEAAQNEADGIRTAAYESGYEAGYEEGRQQITTETEAEVQHMLEAAQVLLDGAFLAEKRVMKAFQKDAHSLVSHVTRRIIGDAFEAQADTALMLIEQAMESLYLSGKVKVVVHPELLAVLKGYTAKTEAAVARMSRFEFMTDELLTPRQIFVLSEQGHFELTPERQADNLLAPLAKNLPLADPGEVAPETPERSEATLLPEAPEGDVDPMVSSPVFEEVEANDAIIEEMPLLENQAEEVETQAFDAEMEAPELSLKAEPLEPLDAEAPSEPVPFEYVAFDDLVFETADLESSEEKA